MVNKGNCILDKHIGIIWIEAKPDLYRSCLPRSKVLSVATVVLHSLSHLDSQGL